MGASARISRSSAPFRALDALFHFLLVWYYCTLTIRESILIANGSRSGPSACRGFHGNPRRLTPLSRLFPQDQRLVGVPPLRVHLPVWRHAHLVSLALSSPAWEKVVLIVCLVPTGLKASSTRCSGSSSSPTASTRVSSLVWLPACLAVEQLPLGSARLTDCVLLCRLRSVPAVLLPERLSVPTADAGRTSHHGPDSRSAPPPAFPAAAHTGLARLSLTVLCPAEGFQSWMWRGLTFLLPFLFFGHVSPATFSDPVRFLTLLFILSSSSSVLAALQRSHSVQDVSAARVQRVAGLCLRLLLNFSSASRASTLV